MNRHARTMLAMLAILLQLLATGLVAQKNDPGAVMLRTAIDKAQVDGDLSGAIKQYQRIVDTFAKTDRAIVATALVKMAECYQKLGDAQAQTIYERIVREYAEQNDAVVIARARLVNRAADARFKGERAAWTNRFVDPFGQVSPDGKKITYVDWGAPPGGPYNVAYHDLTTDTEHRITSRDTVAESAAGGFSAISRDGKQVAYAWQAWGAFDSTERHTQSVYVAPLQEDGHRSARLLFSLKDDATSGPVSLFVSPWDWSPDGKWISVEIEKRRDGIAQLALASVANGSLRILKTLDWRGSGRTFFSPDGRYIAYRQSVNDTSNDSHVMLMAVDGSREVTAVGHPSQNYPLGWSPDGRRLLFASDRTGSFGLWSQAFADGRPQGAPELLKADIGQVMALGVTTAGAVFVWKNVGNRDIQIAPVDLLNGKVGAHTPLPRGFVEGTTVPDWSPDGKQLAYAACSFHCIVVRSADTGESRRLGSMQTYVRPPSWSPDGRSLAFNGRDFKGRNGIFLIDAATGQTTRVVEDVNTQGSPQWSADGTKIYYAAARSLRERDLVSGADREIFRNPGLHDDVRLSPDGKSFAVTIGADPGAKVSRLMTVPVGGGEPRELMHLTPPQGFARRPKSIAWAPDGSAVIVQTATIDPTTLDIVRGHSELWLAPVAGNAPRRLDVDVDAWLRDNGEWFGAGFSLSPDGKRIAFLMGKAAAEVWALENFLPSQTTKK